MKRPKMPVAQCAACGRKVPCVEMPDGVIVKPVAWVYPDLLAPLVGVCGCCK